MLSGSLRECGVVGAGGAGFPAYVKAQSQVEFLIANGAECEPLIHKDAELMKHFPAPILQGMEAMMDATGAASGKFGIKTKNADSLLALKHQRATTMYISREPRSCSTGSSNWASRSTSWNTRTARMRFRKAPAPRCTSTA